MLRSIEPIMTGQQGTEESGIYGRGFNDGYNEALKDVRNLIAEVTSPFKNTKEEKEKKTRVRGKKK